MIEKRTPSRAIFSVCNYAFMVLLCVLCIAPLWHVLMASISDPRMLMGSSSLQWKPAGTATFRGYRLVFKNSQIIIGYVNTLFYVATTTVMGAVLTAMGGFVLSRQNMRLKLPLIFFVLFTMMFSGELIPSYMVSRQLGLVNTRAALIIPGVINAFFLIIMKSAFEQLPASFEESAKLDGAGPMTILVRILLPLVKATVAVVVMFIIVMQWNSWYPASIYLPKRRDLWPLQLSMREILVQNDTAKILVGSDAIKKADMATDALVDERALREYYLAAFETAVREARPLTVMSAYNKVNGVHCSDNRKLLTDILRGEWGFDGVVMSDWGGTHDRIAGFSAGVDLEMPGSKGTFDPEVKAAVECGQLDEGLIDASVSRLLELIARTARDSKEKTGAGIYDRHHALAREIAAAGGVLLKNEENILPLAAETGIIVIGALAETPRYQGTGSSLVSPTRLVNLLEGLSEYSPSVAYHAGYRLADEVDDVLLQAAVGAATSAETVILCVGLTEICESEGYDRETLRLPTNQLRLIEAVVSANPNVIAVIAGGAAIEMPWADGMRAILHMQLAGQAGGQAAADLLFGTVNPSGKLAETYPLRYEDVVCASYYDNPPKQADYRESMFVGYRYFDSVQQAVRFPFGFGLSYTTFAYSDIRVVPLGGYDYEVRFTIQNTGSVAGAEVVQVYVASKTGGAFRPAQELKGFAKVHLQPGEAKEVSVSLCERSFAIYRDQWFVERGEYELRVGASSRDIRLTTSLQLDGVVPQKIDCANWYYTPHGAPSKQDFATVYGKYPDYVPQAKGSFTLESSILEMKDSSFLCRIIYRSIEKQVAKPFGGKADYTSVQFKMLMSSATDNPLHAMRLFSPEFMTARFTRLLVDSANGRLRPGLWRYLRHADKKVSSRKAAEVPTCTR